MGCSTSKPLCQTKNKYNRLATDTTTPGLVDADAAEDEYLEISTALGRERGPAVSLSGSGHPTSTPQQIDSSFSIMSVSLEPEEDSALEDHPVWFDKVPEKEDNNDLLLQDLLFRDIDANGDEIRVKGASRRRSSSNNKSESTDTMSELGDVDLENNNDRKVPVVMDRYDLVANTHTAHRP